MMSLGRVILLNILYLRKLFIVTFVITNLYSHVSIIHSFHGLPYVRPTASSEGTSPQSAI